MRCNGFKQGALVVALTLVNHVLSDDVCTPFTPTSMPKFTASRTTSYSTNIAGGGAIILALNALFVHFQGNSTIDNDVTAPFDPAIADCQAASADWSSISSSFPSPILRTGTVTVTDSYRYTLTKGTACADTTENGFAHAVGEFQSAVTAVSNSLHIYTVENLTVEPVSLRNASVPPRPGCSINIESCSRLWSTFRSSLGITATPTDWWESMFGNAPGYSYPTPPARNYPRCKQISAGCTTYDRPELCQISGENVQIYYWPDQTTSRSRNITKHAPLSRPRTQIVDGITMTSPSIYLSFDYLAALATSNKDVFCYGTQMPDNMTITGAYVVTQVGRALTNAVFSLAPQSVSTLEVGTVSYIANSTSSTIGPFPDAAISAIAGTNQTAYNNWIRYIVRDDGFYYPIASVLKPSDLVRPNPRAYYLRPRLNNEMPINCLPDGPRGSCNTIYDNQYQAQLSIPSEIIKMQPAWSACVPGIHGIYDPPKALTGADDPVEVTVTSQTSSTTTAASPQSPVADATVSSTRVSKPQLTAISSEIKQMDKPPMSPSSSLVQDGISGEKAPSSALLQDVGAAPSQAQPPTTTSLPPHQTMAFTTAAGGPQQDVSNALQALTQMGGSVSTAVPVAMITMESRVLTASSISGNVVLGGTTISTGQVATVDGATISNAGSAVIVQPMSSATTDPTDGHLGSYIANGLGMNPPAKNNSTSTKSISSTAGSAAPSRAVYRGQGANYAAPASRLVCVLSTGWLLVAFAL